MCFACSIKVLPLKTLQVGGVKFEAWPEQFFEELRAHHAEVATWANVSRRSAKNQVDGKLRTIGHRVPMGGRPGDGYGPYAHLSVDTAENITALFDTAKVSDFPLNSTSIDNMFRIPTHCSKPSDFLLQTLSEI